MSATPASVDRSRLNPPDEANTLNEAVRLTLGVLDRDGLLSPFQNVSSLAVEIWHRLARAGFGRRQGSTTDTVAAELRKLVNAGTLRFGGNVTSLPARRPGKSGILAVVGGQAG